MPVFQRDCFSQSRKGFSQFYHLSCRACAAPLGLYQKDGPGPLKRLYIDRLTGLAPEQAFAPEKKLLCLSCQKPLGLGLMYEKENRPAFVLFQSAVSKKPESFECSLWCAILTLVR